MFKFECTFEQFIQIATSKHWRVAAQAVGEGEAAVFDDVTFVYRIGKLKNTLAMYPWIRY